MTTLAENDKAVILDEPFGTLVLGCGDDTVVLTHESRFDGAIFGDLGKDTIELDAVVTDFDFSVRDHVSGNDPDVIELTNRLSGETLSVRGVETFVFEDQPLTDEEIISLFGPDNAYPTILVSEGTQAVTVNDPDATEVVMWNQVMLDGVIEHGTSGPTVASRIYGMVNTAIFDAWASYDENAVRVSLDVDGDNAALEGSAPATEANIAKSISYAAHAVLSDLLPSQTASFDQLLTDRLGYALEGDGSAAAKIGLDAAADLLALRHDDGSNQLDGYADTTGYEPVNPSPLEINDVERWTPENVPTDPEDANPEQQFLTPQWGGVESFALPEDASDNTDHAALDVPPPRSLFTPDFEGSELDVYTKTITLSADLDLAGVSYSAGDEIGVSKDLIGDVINQRYIDQAEFIIDVSANLTESQKLQAEFFEDGGGTAFPPGSYMSFTIFTSARDSNSLEDDIKMFFAVGNAVMDAGIEAWHLKEDTDTTRPIRAIRELGKLGLIGEEGVDELTGESGFVIDAWGGLDTETGEDLGTRTILAENFVTYQRPEGNPSPPFAEYTSGHSTFSAAAAQVLTHVTGSEHFGGSVTFPPGSASFSPNLPKEEITLAWDTYIDASLAAGESRIFGQIHFPDAFNNGQELGYQIGDLVHEKVNAFIDGTATDADRPFSGDELLL